MSQERLEVGQLIPTSATAPSNAGIYSPSQGVLGFTASSVTVTDPITNVRTNVVTGANHAAEHAAMGLEDLSYWTSRPSRLWPVANLPLSAYCADTTHAYGIGSDGGSILAVKLADGSTSYSHYFGSGTLVKDAWLFGNVMLASVAGADLGGGVRQYNLYRSLDKGVTWASVLVADKTDSYFLHQGICEATIGGRYCLLAAEYNVNGSRVSGGANDSVNLWRSDDLGATWHAALTWNVGYHEIRHFHGVAQDQTTGLIFLLCGDDAESRIVSWDGTSPSPATPSVTNLNATSGWKAIGGTQRERFVGIAFKGAHFYGMVDSFAAQSGIWRGKCADLSDFGRVSTGPRYDAITADNNGWYGFTATNGDIYFCTQVTAVSTARQSVVYGSRDGENWYAVAQYRCLANAEACLPRSFHQIPDGRIMLQVDYSTGRLTKQTILMQQSDMDFIEDRPDVLSPVYFVDPVSGSDSTGTGDFQTPWKTVNKAVSGSRITHGARVMITREGVFDEAAVNLAWAAHADNPGETGQPVTISGTGRDTCILNYLTPASSNTIYRPDANNQLEIEHLTARIPATSTCASWSYTSTTTGSFTVKDAILEAFDNGGLVGPGIYIRGGNIRLVRSKLVAPAEHATFTLVGQQAGAVPANTTLDIEQSVFDGGLGSIKITTTLETAIDHATFLGYGSEDAVTLSLALTVAPSITSCAFWQRKMNPCEICMASRGTALR
jgi:hypothetical protein